MSYALALPSMVAAGDEDYSILASLISRYGSRKALVVTDSILYGKGAIDSLCQKLKALGIETSVIADCPSEPSADAVDELIRRMSYEPDLAIAVGGGSVMDITKLISILSSGKIKVRDLISDISLAHKTMMTVAIPTTCGTGSEATYNAIVSLPEKQTKLGIVSQAMLYDAVLLNTGMVKDLPAKLVASTGIDALCHTVECFTGNKANILSNLYASEGTKLILNNIEKAFEGDLEARQSMLLGAFYGGVAISGSGTTAIHALSYPLGGKFHIPHGISNAIMMRPVLRFNQDSIVKELSQLCQAAYPAVKLSSDESRSSYLVCSLAELVKNLGIPSSLEAWGVKASDIDFLTESGFAQKRLLSNNRKVYSKDDIRHIYEEVVR